MPNWIAAAEHFNNNAPYIDNSSVLTIGFVIQIFAVVGLTWKLAQVNTELQLRLARLEYDMNNIADKLRSSLEMIEREKKSLNDVISVVNQNHSCDIDHL